MFTMQQFKDKVLLLHGDIIEYPPEFNYIGRNSEIKIEIICKGCNNKLSLDARTLLDYRKIKFCNYCNSKAVDTPTFKYKFFKKFPKGFSFPEDFVYTTDKELHTIICDIHGLIEVKPNHLFSNKCNAPCRLCNKAITSIEQNVFNLLNEFNIPFKFRYKMKEKLELDFYLPEYNLAIECNGNYWHSDAKTVNDENWYSTHMYNKFTLCNENKIELLQFYEDELLYTFPKVRHLILSKILKPKIEFELYVGKLKHRDSIDIYNKYSLNPADIQFMDNVAIVNDAYEIQAIIFYDYDTIVEYISFNNDVLNFSVLLQYIPYSKLTLTLQNNHPFRKLVNFRNIKETLPRFFSVSKTDNFKLRYLISEVENSNTIYDSGSSKVAIRNTPVNEELNTFSSYSIPDYFTKLNIEFKFNMNCRFDEYVEEMKLKNDIKFNRSFKYEKIDNTPIYRKSETNIKITCLKCNSVFIREIRKHVEGRNCLVCSHGISKAARTSSLNDFQEALKNVFPYYDASKVKDYVNVNTRIHGIYCTIHNKYFSAIPNELTSNKHRACPDCKSIPR